MHKGRVPRHAVSGPRRKRDGSTLKRTIFKRLIHLVVIILGVSFLTFLLMYIAPGDAAQRRLTAQGVVVSQEVLDATRLEMGLDKPFPVQYGDWLLSALRGDLGRSYKDDLPVSGKLTAAVGNTLALALTSLFLSWVISLPLAIWTAVKKGGLADLVIRVFSFIGNSLPNFLLSVLLMYFFCIRLKLLPVIAAGSIRGLLLPCLALVIPLCSRFVRQFRAEILEQLGQEYVLGARTRGVKWRYILFHDVLRNAAPAIMTITALSVGSLLGGSVVIETIFSWPGLGKLAMDAITNRDYPVIQGFVLFTAAVYVLINLLTDLFYGWIDPRVREGAQS